MENFDIAIIGGGPGGYVAAIKAAQAGKKACLIEKDKLGGVCLNQGCIPTKTMIKSVDVLKTVKNCAKYGVMGVDVSTAVIDMLKLQQQKNKVVRKLVGGVGYLLKENGVQVVAGNASFLDKNTITAGNGQIKADNIIIATGSSPARLPVPISGDAPVVTSAEVLNLNRIPEKMIIIGGGVIGIEFAYIFSQLGAQVTVLELLDRILPTVDEEITAEVTKLLRGIGVTINTGSKVIRIEGHKVYFAQEGEEKAVEADKILMSVGRIPDTGGLNLAAIGVQTERNAIAVDDHLRTNLANVYAIGDVNGRMMLAHTASAEGIVAVRNILGDDVVMDYTKIPQCIYLQPEVASVGMTEKQARERYSDIKVGRFPLAANGKASLEGQSVGSIKVIVEPKCNKLLGAHIYGTHATEMISEMTLALQLESTAGEIAGTVHPHPTVSEIIPEAFHAALGQSIHFI